MAVTHIIVEDWNNRAHTGLFFNENTCNLTFQDAVDFVATQYGGDDIIPLRVIRLAFGAEGASAVDVSADVARALMKDRRSWDETYSLKPDIEAFVSAHINLREAA
jgi:hypothetical protein